MSLIHRIFGPPMPAPLVAEFHAQYLPASRQALVLVAPVAALALLSLHALSPFKAMGLGEVFSSPATLLVLGLAFGSWLWLALARRLQSVSLAALTYLACMFALTLLISRFQQDVLLWHTPQFLLWQLVLASLALRLGSVLIAIAMTTCILLVAMLRVGTALPVVLAAAIFALTVIVLTLVIFRTCNRMRRENFLARHSLQSAAYTDALTGMLTRRRFFELGEAAMARAHREGRAVSACFIDLDDFKHINDTLGHAAGDRLLVDTAHGILEVAAAQLARVAPLVARMGGEEFVMLLQTDADAALQVGERVLQRLATIEAGIGRVSASIGVAQAAPGDPLGPLLHAADLAMLQAKAEGKARVVRAGPVPQVDVAA